MNPKTILGVVLVIVLIAVAVQYIDRNDNNITPNTDHTSIGQTDIEDSLEDAGDNLREAANDTGRKLEDAVD